MEVGSRVLLVLFVAESRCITTLNSILSPSPAHWLCAWAASGTFHCSSLKGNFPCRSAILFPRAPAEENTKSSGTVDHALFSVAYPALSRRHLFLDHGIPTAPRTLKVFLSPPPVKSSQKLLPKYIEQGKAGPIKPIYRAGCDWAASLAPAAESCVG